MKQRRLFWTIVDKLETLIDEGVYSVGSRLPAERELAESYEVSRPTIREAIIALEVRERVEVKTGSGVYVLSRNNGEKHQNKISAFELTQARAIIEGEAAALAASTIDEGELSDLKQTLADMSLPKKANEADQKFHEIIAKSTKNKVILNCVENLWNYRRTMSGIVESYEEVCSRNSAHRLEEHNAIYNAIADKDSSLARRAMHNHFNRLLNALFDASEAKALEKIKQETDKTRGLYSISHLTK